jgi:hypothetical protein
MLKWVLEKWMGVWIGFIWLRMGTRGGAFENIVDLPVP